MNDTTGRTAGLLRILGVGFGLAVIVGSTLGIGILRTPGLVAGQLSSRTSILAVWLAGGLYTLLGSIIFTELGTMLPEAGGYYVYARRAFGDTVGFAVGWTDWLTYCAVLGYESIAIGEFSAMLLPALQPAVKLVAVTVLVLFAALQFGGLRVSSRFQEITTAVKFLAFLALVAACLVYASSHGPSGGGYASVVPVDPGLVGLVIALQSVVITYGGWQSALYFTEEDRDPRQNLPRSMIGGVLSVLVIYLLVNVALLSVLPIAELARSTLPAADAASVIFGSRGGQLIILL
ncbi:MAG TPA: amino acid permease, partial [Vicinamibacteria bacterium]